MAALQVGLDATNAALTQLKAHFESVLPKFTVYDASQQELAAWRATVEGMLTTQKNEQEDLMSTQATTIADLPKLYADFARAYQISTQSCKAEGQ